MEKGRIGLNAGKVWHALNEVNEISTQELSRKLSLSIEDLALAIGWLARENNIYITRKNGLLYVNKDWLYAANLVGAQEFALFRCCLFNFI